MKFKIYSLEEISTINAGGDKPKVFSEIKTNMTQIPIYSNGLDNEGLFGYTNKSKINGDVVTIAARGVNAGFVCYREVPFFPIVRLLSIIPNKEIVYPKYLYYVLKNMRISGDGSAQPQITKPMISKLKVNLHQDIEIQKKIANYLTIIDEKIKLNSQINNNLIH